jgi:hypothetical protein
MCVDAGNVRCVVVCGCSPLSSWMVLALWGLLHLLLRVACVDLPTLICIKHNGDDKPEESIISLTNFNAQLSVH